MNIHVIIDTGSAGRITGYSELEMSTNNPDEEIMETSEGVLAEAFKEAKSNGEKLEGVGDTIDNAINNPTDFIDFLTTSSGGDIVFNSDYVREPIA